MVDDGVNDVLHVVRLVRAFRQDRVQLGLARSIGVVARGDGRALLVVLRQEPQQPAHERQRLVFVRADEVRDAALRGVDVRPAELLGRHRLARDLLHDLGPGQEHVARAPRHADEVGDRRAVDRAARAGTENEADLRHDAGVQDVLEEDVGVAGKRVDALLDPRAARVVEADDRRAHLGRQVHDLADLLRVGLRQAAAEDGEVLAEHEHQPPVDGPVAGDDPVGERLLLFHPEVRAAVRDEGVELLEAPFVEQPVDALAGGVLALPVLFLDAGVAAGPVRLLAQVGEFEDLVFDGHAALRRERGGGGGDRGYLGGRSGRPVAPGGWTENGSTGRTVNTDRSSNVQAASMGSPRMGSCVGADGEDVDAVERRDARESWRGGPVYSRFPVAGVSGR